MTETTSRRNAHRPAAVLASIALATGAFAGAGVVMAGPALADVPASSEQTARFEVDFLTGMIDHHAMAVSMAEMCLEEGVHDELIATCESIITSQSTQIEQMQAWLQDWYGIDYEPGTSSGGSMNHLANLSGEEFEVAFMRSMIRHHWGAIREAEKCFDNAEHPDLLTLCEDIYTAQLEEIEQMQTWLDDWYGIPGGRPVSTA
ncbi:DUF305 domain-containing protein [Georgenia daeguensis]|uniref:DUF305 domain-containing protein n=1 Tax=Georgenia daeguensis TaxID=908355 RepID=A0ABP8EYR0_9MICO